MYARGIPPATQKVLVELLCLLGEGGAGSASGGGTPVKSSDIPQLQACLG